MVGFALREVDMQGKGWLAVCLLLVLTGCALLYWVRVARVWAKDYSRFGLGRAFPISLRTARKQLP